MDNRRIAPPPCDPERPTDDPWDADSVRYLLGQPGVRSEWTRGALMECLRRQPVRVRDQPERVDAAAVLASRYGVRQVEEPRGQRTIVHLYRTDAGAPSYPATQEERARLLKDTAP